MTRGLALILAATALAGCGNNHRQQAAQPNAVTYVVGAPYQSNGVWHYPRESFETDETGLASVTTRISGLTADGEVADASAMAAAHPSLQLPAIARVTGLDTGLQVLVRVNDRGPAERGRVIALTPRVMRLLGAAGQSAVRVRVQVMGDESRQLAAVLNGSGAPRVEVQTAPTIAIAAEALPPPRGAQQSTYVRRAFQGPRPIQAAATSAAPIPLRLPEMLARVPARPGALYIEIGTFGGLQYAELLRVRLASLGAETLTSYDAPRDRAYRVRIGPLTSVAAADAMLDRTIRAGINDARIVAE